jgi:hypothetical protein
MRNLVCLMLELLFFYLLCVIMFEPDCILIGSCACGCPNKTEFSRDSHTKSLWGTPAMTKQKVQNASATTKYLLRCSKCCKYLHSLHLQRVPFRILQACHPSQMCFMLLQHYVMLNWCKMLVYSQSFMLKTNCTPLVLKCEK